MRKSLLIQLLDKYEKSKSFIGDNKVNQKFVSDFIACFLTTLITPILKYFEAVNEAIDILVREAFVFAKSNSAHVYSNVILNLDEIG